jgi:hypothetical protein
MTLDGKMFNFYKCCYHKVAFRNISNFGDESVDITGTGKEYGRKEGGNSTKKEKERIW